MVEKFNPSRRDFLKKMTLAGAGLAVPGVVKAAVGAFESVEKSKKFNITSNLEEVEENEPLILHVQAEFITATTEFADASAEKKIQDAIKNFLVQAIEFEHIDLTKAEIKVIGTYSKERDWENNPQIAKARMELGVKMLKEALSSPAVKLNKKDIPVIEENIRSESRGKSIYEIYGADKLKSMTKAQTETAIDSCQGFDIEIIVKTEDGIGKPENKNDLSIYAAIFMDDSGSMVNDYKAVERTVEEIKNREGKDIQIIPIEGQTVERHIDTLERYISKMGPSRQPRKVLVITDEPDNSIAPSNYENRISNLLGAEVSKRANVAEIVVKVLNPNGDGSYKMFSLNTNEGRNALKAPAIYAEGDLQQKWYDNLENSAKRIR